MMPATPPDHTPSDAADPAHLIARRQRLLGPAYRLFYEQPVHLVRGEDVWLFDPQGRRYLDAYNNVASVGHCHPQVVAALAQQAAVLNTHTRYLHEAVLAYAERLLGHFPSALSQVMFTCTGSEANDLALRVARACTGGTGVIVTDCAYHGVTSALAELSPSLGPGNPLGPHVRTVPAPARGGDVGAAFARHVRSAIADLQRCGIQPAALLVDTVFSSDGVFTEPAGFLAEAVADIRAAGGLFIADEVQPGFGRTGTHFWGFQRHDLVPDIVTLGKPMGNGHPLAGMVCQPARLAAFGQASRYFNTFGGNPVSAHVGLAVLAVIEAQQLQANAERVGLHLRQGLRQLAARHPLIGDIRGEGLFVGVEFLREGGAPASAEATRIVNGLRARHVLAGLSGRHGNTLKLRPPLTFSTAHADLLLSALDDALTAGSA